MLLECADVARYCDLPLAEKAAQELGEYLFASFTNSEGTLLHSRAKGKDGPAAYLEDYATLIEGCIKLYSCCGDPVWMERASTLTRVVLEDFSAEGQPFFFFSSHREKALIRKSIEVADNVIPASNSIMAKNLFQLGLFWEDSSWIQRAEDMLSYMKDSMSKYSGQYSNWMQLALWLEYPFFETVVSGPQAQSYGRILGSKYLPHTLIAYSDKAAELPLFRHRQDPEHTRIFICSRGACQQPMEEVEQAFLTLRKELIRE